MFGIGFPELIMILVVALLVVGPSKLPELAKSLGKAFNDFRRMADEVKETFEEEVLKEDKKPEETAHTEPPPDEKPDEKKEEATAQSDKDSKTVT